MDTTLKLNNGDGYGEMNNLYHYKAICTDVYDADTISASIFLGFNIELRKRKLRLNRINAFEIRHKDPERNAVCRFHDQEPVED